MWRITLKEPNRNGMKWILYCALSSISMYTGSAPVRYNIEYRYISILYIFYILIIFNKIIDIQKPKNATEVVNVFVHVSGSCWNFLRICPAVLIWDLCMIYHPWSSVICYIPPYNYGKCHGLLQNPRFCLWNPPLLEACDKHLHRIW